MRLKLLSLICIVLAVVITICFVDPHEVSAQTSYINVDESSRTVENSYIKISWDQTNAERIDEYYFKPFSATRNIAGSHPLEFTAVAVTFDPSNNYSITHELVSSRNTGFSWQYFTDDDRAYVEINSDSNEGLHVATVYEIVADSPVVKMTRTFGFSSKPLVGSSRLLPYFIRAYDRSSFYRYAWEVAGGGAQTSEETCEYGCTPENWAQTWIDLEAPNLGVGIGLVNYYLGSQSQPWLDRDMASNTAFITTSIPNYGFNSDLVVPYLIVPHLGDYTNVDWAYLSHWGVPTPFLDLPWDYQSKGMSFSEAALEINSYFDHQYPLLSTSLQEQSEVNGGVVNYRGFPSRLEISYSSHDGYDWGRRAGATHNEPVLAAAAGVATFKDNCGACGNVILIDHGNGYQSRYYHLLSEGLIIHQSGQSIQVIKGQQIGKVGFTGNVSPPGVQGSHIHFMVVQDKNHDGNFEDNIPDGVTDPFGWQSTDADPWPNYIFTYNGVQRRGNRSFYLWTKAIANLSTNISSNGGYYELEHYSIAFPEGSVSETTRVNIFSSPWVRASELLNSIGFAINITAQNLFGGSITNFLRPFTLGIDFSSLDISRFNPSTISFYSSDDGISWIQEQTIVDLNTRTATTQVDHLSYFALMAERLDTLAPQTTAVLSGDENSQGVFNSKVEISLEAYDNDGGLGVGYTGFKLDDSNWQDYQSPIVVEELGDHILEYYSVDNDENMEEIKTTTFNVVSSDVTPPELGVIFNRNALNTELIGIDEAGETEIVINDGTNGDKVVDVIDSAGNKIRVTGKFNLESTPDKVVIKTVAYNDGPSSRIDYNYYDSDYKTNSNGNVVMIMQQCQYRGSDRKLRGINIEYRTGNDITNIVVKEENMPFQKTTENGFKTLYFQTKAGNLECRYQ